MEIVIPNVKERMEEEDLLLLIEDIDGVVCGDDRFTKEVYERATRLKVISKWGTGIDSINKTLAEEYGVKVYNTPDAFSHPVSETAFAYMLAFSRNVIVSDIIMKNGGWSKPKGITLGEQTLGIVGCGNIGTRMARMAAAFDMTILTYDIREIPEYIKEPYRIEQVDFETLLRKSDFVSLHCDLNDTSRHIMNKRAFEMMKDTAYVINTSRGGVIDENALVDALKKKKIAGCGLDVFEIEPLPQDSELRRMENVILSSHNSNSSPLYWERVHENTLKNLYEGLLKEV